MQFETRLLEMGRHFPNEIIPFWYFHVNLFFYPTVKICCYHIQHVHLQSILNGDAYEHTESCLIHDRGIGLHVIYAWSLNKTLCHQTGLETSHFPLFIPFSNKNPLVANK